VQVDSAKGKQQPFYAPVFFELAPQKQRAEEPRDTDENIHGINQVRSNIRVSFDLIDVNSDLN
jgi:hypothetical protein